MLFNKIVITVLSMIVMACSSANKTAEANSNTDTTSTKEIMKEASMKEAGFVMAEVVESKVEGDCPFTLKINAENPYYLDPIDMTDDFKKHGEKVWVKYAGLRRMNRCEKANPVSIVEIERRTK